MMTPTRLLMLLLLTMAGMLSPGGRDQAQASDDHYALMMVWMPGLCALEPDRPECKDLSLRRYDGQNLAFQAIEIERESGAPQTYCFTMPSDSEMDRSRDWCDMSEPRLSPELAKELETLMPIAQSCQDRGLWAHYASCTMYSADDYYSRGFRLAKAVAATLVNVKIAGAVGRTVSQQALVTAFEQQFGDETGRSIDFICRKRDGKSHLLNVKITLTAKALSRGLAPDYLWKPDRSMRRSCPESIVVDAPPGTELGTPAAQAAPPPPPKLKPAEPGAPPSVPVGTVETEPLSPPEKAKIIAIPSR
jgi:ribonuclease I